MKQISILCGLFLAGIVSAAAQNNHQTKQFTEDLLQKDCTFAATGRNQFFILEPGYQLTLENKSGGKLVVTVLNETRKLTVSKRASSKKTNRRKASRSKFRETFSPSADRPAAFIISARKLTFTKTAK